MIHLGQRFTAARKEKHVTLEQAAKTLKIRIEFLHALEHGDYTKLPSSAYAVGFVGNYAEYLGLSKAETIAMFKREFDEKRVYKVLPDEFTKTKEFKVKRISFHRTLGIFLVIMFCVIGYILFQYRYAILNPSLVIFSPEENEVLHSTHIQVTGKSDPNVVVQVNNNAVFIDKDGNFSKRLDVFEGKTVLQITATNRFGKKISIERHITIE